MVKETNRRKSYLAAEAIAEHVEMDARQTNEIKRRLRRAKAGAPGVPHAEVEAWIKSWASRMQRPKPKV